MGLDSIELLVETEKYFSIKIPDRDAEKANTVGKFIDCISTILKINHYDFKLRNDTFLLIKRSYQILIEIHQDFLITDKVINTLNLDDVQTIAKLEKAINLKLPGINTSKKDGNGLFAKFKNWIDFSIEYDFNQVTWKQYINAILAHNLETVINPTHISSKYEVLIALTRLIVDRIGVDYLEIGIEKSFTDDLGVD